MMVWMKLANNLPILALCLLHFSSLCQGLSCYECDSSSDFMCTEFWPEHASAETDAFYSDCGHVHDANFCVKMAGVFEGKLGTKRFCSSRDWGDYCEYIKRPGDIQEYRSCVFTCDSHGCNHASIRGLDQGIITSMTILSIFSTYIWI